MVVNTLIQQKLGDIVFAFNELLIGWRDRHLTELQYYTIEVIRLFNRHSLCPSLHIISTVLDTGRTVVNKTNMVPAFMKLPSEVNKQYNHKCFYYI